MASRKGAVRDSDLPPELICRLLEKCCEWDWCATCKRCYCECFCRNRWPPWRQHYPWRDEFGQGVDPVWDDIETIRDVREEFL